jgi:hypothetical protein
MTSGYTNWDIPDHRRAAGERADGAVSDTR